MGATIALLCDITIAVDTASIADPHVRIGLVAGDGGALIWPQLVGYAKAKEYLLTGSRIKAAEAARLELLGQLNRVLDTKDTPRGLVVNMADVLFDTGKYDLKSEAREKLAKLSGILATHPGLQLEVEGHTDNTGGVQINQGLSEQRAQTVAKYLVDQGVSGKNVKSTGLGDSQPVAENSSASGRQKNRRVEIIVSGEAIGSTIGK